jgi:hypothetical protein
MVIRFDRNAGICNKSKKAGLINKKLRRDFFLPHYLHATTLKCFIQSSITASSHSFFPLASKASLRPTKPSTSFFTTLESQQQLFTPSLHLGFIR